MPVKRKKSGKGKRRPNGRKRNKYKKKTVNTKSHTTKNENIKPEYHCFVVNEAGDDLWSVLNYKDVSIYFYLDKLAELEGVPYDSINILSYHNVKQCGQEIKLFKHKGDLDASVSYLFTSNCDRNYWHNAITNIICARGKNKSDNSQNDMLYFGNALCEGQILTVILETCSNDLYLYTKYDNINKNGILFQKIELKNYNNITVSENIPQSLFKHILTLSAKNSGKNIALYFKKNNETQEWFTHLDFIMNHQINPYIDSINTDQKDEIHIIETENEDNNSIFNKSLNVLLKILQIYDESDQTKIELNLNISYVDILNHFNNIIKDFHCNIDLDKIALCKSKFCTESECVHTNRHQVKRERNKNERNKNVLITELLEKIHCFIFHSNLQNRDENTIRISRPNNKFVISTQNIKNQFNQTNNEEKEGSDINIDEIDEMQNHSEQLAFAFGEVMHFYCHGATNYINAYYPTLKEELISNPYYKLSMNEYYDYYIKAVNIIKTKKFQNIKATDMDELNNMSEIDINDKISINHIITLMTYCNETELQRIFKQQTRKANENESKYNVFKNASFICHWLRYLNESCVFYGKQMQKHQFVYCGMDRKVIFNTFNFSNYSPISTSSEITVANNFATNKGIILKLKRHTSLNSRYFDMEYISDYVHEKELFFCGNARFNICDIIISGKRNSNKILSLKLLELILNGNIFVYEFNNHQFSDNVIDGLIYLLDKYIKLNENNEDYFVQLTQALIRSYLIRDELNDPFGRKILFINSEEIQKLNNSSLLSYFSESSVLMQQFKAHNIKVRYIKKVFRYRLNKNEVYQLENSKQYECVLGNFVIGKWRFRFTIDYNKMRCADYVGICIEATPTSTTFSMNKMEVLVDIVCEQIEYQHHQIYRELSMGNEYFAGIKLCPISMLSDHDLNSMSIDLNFRLFKFQ